VTVRLIRRPVGLGEPLGRYSHVGIGRGELVAVAGQVGLDTEGRLAGSDLASQALQSYRNLGFALTAAVCSY